jgi:cytoskeletal protein RodZ
MNKFFSRYRLLIAVAIMAVLIAGVWYFSSQSQIPSGREKIAAHDDVVVSPSSTPIVVGESNTRTTTNPAPRQLTVSSSAEDGEDATIPIPVDRPRFASADSPAQRRAGENDVDLRKASTSLRDYRQAFKQNPVGNNAQITRTLSGKNSRNMKYLPADAHINDKGELTDRLNQPLFFHQISSTLMEIRAAGPDHVMWTADDEVLR